MTRKATMLAVLATLIVGLMTAGVRAGDTPARSADDSRSTMASEQWNGARPTLARGCQTLKCINRTLKKIIKALNGICVIPITQYGNPLNDNSGEGFMYDTTPFDNTKGFNTSALDITEVGGTPGALMLVDCP